MSKELKSAINIIRLLLLNNDNFNGECAYEWLQVQSGNKKVIREHLLTLKDIFNKALKDLGDEE